MPADATTFTLAFLSVFAVLAYLLVRMERTARRLEERVAALEARRGPPPT